MPSDVALLTQVPLMPLEGICLPGGSALWEASSSRRVGCEVNPTGRLMGPFGRIALPMAVCRR